MTPPRPTVTVVGLGPAGPEWATAAVLDAAAAHRHRFLRTRRHPAAELLTDAVSFDDIYEDADSYGSVYRAIAERLSHEAREHGSVLYAVPGSPRVLERSVELLALDDTIDLRVLPAVSFLDLVWDRLAVDPVEASVRLVDGHRFAIDAAGERGPLLVAHCHNQRVLGDIKLCVDEPPAAPVTVLQRLGLPDEAVVEVEWAELDRVVEADHLTSLWIPELAAPIAGEVQRFVDLVHELRNGCPWDQEQTHRSLIPHLLEEAYEVVEAIQALPAEAGRRREPTAERAAGPTVDALDDRFDHLEEELGDLLFQVVFHAELAGEQGRFSLADVARTVHDKLYRRHPHVFGEREVTDTAELEANWERLKAAEKGERTSVVDGIPATLPAAMYAAKLARRMVSVDTPPADVAPLPLAEAHARLDRLAAEDPPAMAHDVGEALFAVVDLARHHGVDAELALRAAADRRVAGLRASGH